MYSANSLFKSATHFGFDLLCPVRLRRKEKAAIPLGAESTEHRVLRRRSSEYFWMRPCALSFLSAPDGVVGHLFAPGPTDASKVKCQTAVQRAPRAVRITRGIAWGQVIHEIDMFDFVADHRLVELCRTTDVRLDGLAAQATVDPDDASRRMREAQLRQIKGRCARAGPLPPQPEGTQ
jgi:hypothetical protein